jgi:hypothetical protein
LFYCVYCLINAVCNIHSGSLFFGNISSVEWPYSNIYTSHFPAIVYSFSTPLMLYRNLFLPYILRSFHISFRCASAYISILSYRNIFLYLFFIYFSFNKYCLIPLW